MLSIRLNNLRFFSRHGLYDEEKKLSREFEVNVLIEYMPAINIISDIRETIDYSAVYHLIKSCMAKPEPLLETLVMRMANEILDRFVLAETVKIAVTKLHPPIKNFTGNVEVVFSKSRAHV